MSNINITPFYSKGYENAEIKTISSIEVAEMMGKEHYEILQYLEGRKDKEGKTLVTGIIPTLETEGLQYQKYFIPSTYKAGRREYKCYLVTKMGCELLGNKQQGEKGILFTAKYVERFNQMEKHINQQLDSYMIADPIERAKRWIEEQSLANQQIGQLEVANTALNQQIGELKPKADYTDIVLKNKGLVTITAIAKDYGMSGGALNKKLHKLGIQYKQGSQWFLYSKYHDKGYTSSETNEITRSNGLKDIVMNTKWTQKGRLFIYNELKEIGIVPLIEQDKAS